jgi:hypothetical protein
MRVFIGGVMQASRVDDALEDQGYRNVLADVLRLRWPGLEVVDPLAIHPNSVTYDDEAARATLFALLELATGCDVLIAYVPQASMGTALEMYVAYQQGVPVLTISPMRANWVVRSLSQRIFPDLDSFMAYLGTVSEPAPLRE